MEVLARDLQALGLYSARSPSFDGVEYEMLEHALTAPQVAIYDDHARAFAIIHSNLNAAMRDDGSTRNSPAKSAARLPDHSASVARRRAGKNGDVKRSPR